MKNLFFAIVIVLSWIIPSSALEEMTVSELKNSTAQAATVTGDIGGAIEPVSSMSDTFGPAIIPVAHVVELYQLVSPHVDPVLHMRDANDTTEPVTRIMRTTGEITFLGSMF